VEGRSTVEARRATERREPLEVEEESEIELLCARQLCATVVHTDTHTNVAFDWLKGRSGESAAGYQAMARGRRV